MAPKGPKINHKRQLKLRETLDQKSQTNVVGETAYTQLMEILNPTDPKRTGQEGAEAGSLQPVIRNIEGDTPSLTSEGLMYTCSSVRSAETVEDDFDIISDVERIDRPKSTALVSAKDQASRPTVELNAIFRKEHSRGKKKKSKNEKKKTDDSKRRTEKMGLDSEEYRSSLEEELAEHKENAPRVDTTTAHDRQETTDVAKGCLFLHCFRCPSMVRIKFSSGLIPKMSVDLDADYANGVMFTLCKTCDDVKENPHTRGYGWDDEVVADFAGRFRGLNMDPGIMKGSNFMRAANLVSSIPVDLMTAVGRLHFENRSTILDHAKHEDEIASIDVDKVDSGDVNAILKGHLNGGFF